VISGVASGTPAAAAGLTGGDVITGVSGTAITSSAGLTAALQGHHPGDKVKLTWTDQSGATHSATITLGSGPAD
jgi:S1-C subfamily serine protease